MKYVYILRSVPFPAQRYIGITADLRRRLEDHNSAKGRHSCRFRPWRVETYVAFSDEGKALEFERYLKTGSGWAFALKRF